MGFDAEIIRARISTEMAGCDCLLMINEQHYKKMQYGEEFNVRIDSIPDEMKRSLKQLDLYWAACQLVAENTDDPNWNTKEKVDEQTKIAAHLYEFYIHYHNRKTGETALHIKTGSIAFKNLPHLEACGYFTDAFNILAVRLGITVEELISETKRRMRGSAA